MPLKMTGCTFGGNKSAVTVSAKRVDCGSVDRSVKTDVLTEEFRINGVTYFASKNETFNIVDGVAFWGDK